MPMPATAHPTRSWSADISHRMPATLRSPISRSLGQTMRASGPRASAAPTATTIGSIPASTGATGGRSSTETSSACPRAASHERPRRPRPALWRSAPTTVPSGAPSRARTIRSSLVEPVSADQVTGPASGGRSRGATRAGTTRSASGSIR